MTLWLKKKKKAVNAGAFECVHTGCKVLLRYLHFTDACRLHEQQSYIKYSHISCLDSDVGVLSEYSTISVNAHVV